MVMVAETVMRDLGHAGQAAAQLPGSAVEKIADDGMITARVALPLPLGQAGDVAATTVTALLPALPALPALLAGLLHGNNNLPRLHLVALMAMDIPVAIQDTGMPKAITAVKQAWVLLPDLVVLPVV
jgi:hypothetical protein